MTALAVGIFVITYALIATERIHRVQAAIGGAVAMAAVGLIDTEAAFYNPDRGVDWNVIFLLFGMMVIVSVASDRTVRLPRRVVGPRLAGTTVPTDGAADRGHRRGLGTP